MCCVFRPASACLHMHSHGQKQWKMLENYQKVLFSSYAWETHVRLRQEHWKKYFFDNFWAFFIVFDHVNACASMQLLVKIHNKSAINKKLLPKWHWNLWEYDNILRRKKLFLYLLFGRQFYTKKMVIPSRILRQGMLPNVNLILERICPF